MPKETKKAKKTENVESEKRRVPNLLELDGDLVSYEEAVPKEYSKETSKGTETGTYNTIPVRYDGDQFVFEVELKVKLVRSLSNGEWKYSLIWEYNPRDSSHKKIRTALWDNVYMPGVRHLMKDPDSYNLPWINEEDPVKGGFTFPIRRLPKKGTKKFDMTKPETWWMGLTAKGPNKTVFIPPTRKGQKPVPIPWGKLLKKSITGVVTLYHTDIYNEKTTSMRFFTLNMVVTDFEASNAIRDLSTAHNLAENNPELVSKLMEKLEQTEEAGSSDDEDSGDEEAPRKAANTGTTFGKIPKKKDMSKSGKKSDNKTKKKPAEKTVESDDDSESESESEDESAVAASSSSSSKETAKTKDLDHYYDSDSDSDAGVDINDDPTETEVPEKKSKHAPKEMKIPKLGKKGKKAKK